MASEQAKRENVTDERQIHVPKDRVPQMASHFESLAEKVQGSRSDIVPPAGPDAVHVKSTVTTTEQRPGHGAHYEKSHDQHQSQQAKVGGLEFGGMHQSQRSVDQSRSAEQGRNQPGFEQRPGGVKFEVRGQEHKGSDTGRHTQMHGHGLEGESGGQVTSKETQAMGQGEDRARQTDHQERGTKETKSPSLEEISQHRATAQQNSMEAIRAAEERFEKAKFSAASTLHNVKESATHGLGAAGTYATEKGAQAKDTITHGVQKGSQYVAETAGAAKDTALEKGQQAYVATKDTLSSAGQTAVQSAQQAKDYTLQKAGDTKNYVAHKAEETKKYVAPKTEETRDTKDYVSQKAGENKGYAPQKAGETKDYVGPRTEEAEENISTTGDSAGGLSKAAAEKSTTSATYVGQKAAQVKDVTVETGKSAAGYAGKVAETVKDRAVVAGWGAAHFTAEKAAEATKAVAGVASTVAGYAGGTAVAAKDVVSNAGKRTVGYAEDKLAAAKDYVISAEESAAEYAARKKAEAERELGARRSHDTKEGSQGGHVSGGKQESQVKWEETGHKASEEVREESGGGEESKQQKGHGAAVVLQAIGETIVEIGKTTTDLVAGRRVPQTDYKEEESVEIHEGQSK